MKTYLRFCANCLAFFAIIPLCGCLGPKVLKDDYVDFAENYAKVNNEQLLLNLARLANDDPVNFIQLGSFSSQYNFGTALGFSPSYVNNYPLFYQSGKTTGSTPPTGGNSSVVTTFLKNALTLGGSATANVTEMPIFQYFPLTGTNLVTAVMTPINPNVYYTMYDQGYPADLLTRTMVASVGHQTGTTNYLGSTITNYEYFVNSPADDSYPKFLDFCENLYQAQLAHVLTVGVKPDSREPVFSGTNAKLTDVIAALQANLSLECNTNSGKIIAIQPSVVKSFEANLDTNGFDLGDVYSTLANSCHYSADGVCGSAHYVADDRCPEDDLKKALELAEDWKDNKYVLKMRTVEAAMYTVAQEEERFANTNNLSGYSRSMLFFKIHSEARNYEPFRNVRFLHDQFGFYALVTRPCPDLTHFKVRPLMRLTCRSDEIPPSDVLAQIMYGDGQPMTYYVGDPEGVNQSRMVFTILSYLFAQTAISTQNLPVQQLIQVQ